MATTTFEKPVGSEIETLKSDVQTLSGNLTNKVAYLGQLNSWNDSTKHLTISGYRTIFAFFTEGTSNVGFTVIDNGEEKHCYHPGITLTITNGVLYQASGNGAFGNYFGIN